MPKRKLAKEESLESTAIASPKKAKAEGKSVVIEHCKQWLVYFYDCQVDSYYVNILIDLYLKRGQLR